MLREGGELLTAFPKQEQQAQEQQQQLQEQEQEQEQEEDGEQQQEQLTGRAKLASQAAQLARHFSAVSEDGQALIGASDTAAGSGG
jgi:hypothetical protein